MAHLPPARTALNYFTESCHKQNLDEVEAERPAQVFRFPQRHERADHAVSTGLVTKNDWPRYTEEEPEIYEQAELDQLFNSCDAEATLISGPYGPEMYDG